MRSFRTPLIAGVGALALAGTLIFPGIAGADAAPSTATVTAAGDFTLTATDKGECAAEFTMSDVRESGNWRADFRIDGEDANMPGGLRPVYRPVVVSNQKTVDAIQGRADKGYDIALNKDTVDLTKDRTVPVNNDKVKTVPGVTPNADGTHTVDFGVYQGPTAVHPTESIYDKKATITVTGCPTTPEVPEEEVPEAGSLDFLGSLKFGSLFGSMGSLGSSDAS